MDSQEAPAPPFESVYRPAESKPRRWRLAIAIAFAVHLSGLMIVGISFRTIAPPAREPPQVTFIVPVQAPPPPPPAAARRAPAEQRAERPAASRSVPREVRPLPLEPPAEAEQTPARTDDAQEMADGEDDGVEGGRADGMTGGEKGGASGGLLGGIGRVEFDDRMTPPRKLSGPDPGYTPEALRHEVEGTIVVKCAVMLDGSVRDCRVLKSLPYLDDAVVSALESRHYSPAVLDSQPVECDYTFRVHLELPPLPQ